MSWSRRKSGGEPVGQAGIAIESWTDLVVHAGVYVVPLDGWLHPSTACLADHGLSDTRPICRVHTRDPIDADLESVVTCLRDESLDVHFPGGNVDWFTVDAYHPDRLDGDRVTGGA